jgi:hypothetical protein
LLGVLLEEVLGAEEVFEDDESLADDEEPSFEPAEEDSVDEDEPVELVLSALRLSVR